MKSVLMAYLLWCLGGPLGLYKFYLGRPGMGLLYVFTCGGFLVGWLSDFLTLPRQVQMANLLLHYQSERPGSVLRRELEELKRTLYTLLAGDTNTAPAGWRDVLKEKMKPRFTDEELMVQLLRASQKHGGRLSVTQGVMETGVLFGDVERVLQSMVKSNYVYVDNDPATGVLVYVFKEIF
ncbi:MAG: TM2 domain-containing protein [Candidatus Tectomicrobia bacterium]|uniref:TM2 domain-containing protein n=1 Tax=Tectimicrobiota bacterium TaxID=2528274 RepID=A0A937W260_UNCTE|nr:TM2 domain-containing protein [Candidatus Tectomicrobia bacterium]